MSQAPRDGPGPPPRPPGPPSNPSHPSQAGAGSSNGMRYDDPTNLLSSYPFMTYQPTARTAMHLASHTVTLPPPSSSFAMYPEHTALFNRLDTPRTEQDSTMRHAAEAQVRGMLNGNQSYYNSYRPTTNAPNFEPSRLAPYPTAHVSPAYHYLPSYLPNSSRPTNGEGTTATMAENNPEVDAQSAVDYFDDFVTRTLQKKQQADQQQPSSQSSQPLRPLQPSQFSQHSPAPQPLRRAPPSVASQPSQQSKNPQASDTLTQQAQQTQPRPSGSTGQPRQSQPGPSGMPTPHSQHQQQSQTSQQPPSQPSEPPTPQPATPVPHNQPISTPAGTRRASSAASVNSTPGLTVAMGRTTLDAASSPDPLGFTGPSPAKKRKPSKPVSPTLQYSQNFPKLTSSSSSSLSQSESQMRPRSSSITPSLDSPAYKHKQVVTVEIPLRRTPLAKGLESIRVDDDDSEEEGLSWEEDNMDKDGEWEMNANRFRSPSPGVNGQLAPQGSIRTGERDLRTHYQKLQSLLEDVFEESDSFPAEPSVEVVSSSRYFSISTQESAHPVLSDAALGKVNQYIKRLQKGKRRQSTELIEWDVEAVGRLLRLLETCMRGANDTTPFIEDNEPTNGKKGQANGLKKGSRSVDRDEATGVQITQDEELREQAIREGERRLKALRSAGLAAECSLVVLSLDGLTKQVLSEDLLSTAVDFVKEQITKAIIPVVETLAGESSSSKFLNYIVRSEQSKSVGKSKNLSQTFTNPTLASMTSSCVASLTNLTSLIARPDIAFSDQLAIQTIYLSIAPLFVAEPVAKKSKTKDALPSLAVMKGLRVEALSCLGAVFARYEQERQFVIDEILDKMGHTSKASSGQARFQLANGGSIHTVSALLLHLVQASVFGVTARVKKLRSSLVHTEDAGGSQTDTEKLDSLEEEMRICADTVESALKSARIVSTYLLQRSRRSRVNKRSHDTDYKEILDFFVADLLSVLYRPEWPAAPLYLTVLSQLLMSALVDRQSHADDSSAKSVALDYLGDIAAKLRTFQLQMDRMPVASLDQIISDADPDSYRLLNDQHQTIHALLSNASRDDGIYASALDMTTLVWAQELQTSIKKTVSIIDKLATEKGVEAQENRDKLQIIGQSLRSTLREVWIGPDNLFEATDPSQADSASEASIAIYRGRPLQTAFNPILSALVTSMGDSLIAIRAKALRGLGSVITVDPEVLAHASVQAAIEDRLSDSAPSVRDAAVELVGKYVVQKPNLASEYYPHLALRVSDTGLGVRKRVIKLLRGIFATTEIRDIKIDICCKMVVLTGDMDDSIKELAIKTLTDMLYSSQATASETAELLVEVVAVYQGGVALEIGIQEVVRECEKTGAEAKAEHTMACLFERLTDATERNDIDTLNDIKTIHLLVLARPDLVDVNRAETLLPYLKKRAPNTGEQSSNELLLKIFRLCIPSMPRVASSFALKLNEALLGMITAPSGNYPTLKETIACFCAVAVHLTRDFGSILKVLVSCEAKVRVIRDEWKKLHQSTKAEGRAAPILLFICATIAEYCDLDKLAESNSEVKSELKTITNGLLYEHLFECFLEFTTMPIPQPGPSMCLGSLFRAYPILILREEAMAWMDGVFAGPDTTTQTKLLGVIHEFLVSESEKKQATTNAVTTRRASGPKKGKEMDDLIGIATDLSESGLSTAVVQRNIEHILAGAKSPLPHMQNAALDILAFTVNQGLYHPLQCLPILIALETSDNAEIAERALDLHRVLHSKHSNLVNVRYEEFAKAAYEYQRSLTSEVLGHRHGLALLSGWYLLVGEKRALRHEFLRQITRVFDYDVAGKTVPDVGLVLFISDNLCTFYYKLQEEIMTVVHLLSRVVSGATGLVMLLERTELEGDANGDITGRLLNSSEDGETSRADVVIHASIVVGLAILVKNYLLDVYAIPEDKCIKYAPGKKSALGDKPAGTKREDLLDTSRMGLVRGVKTVSDFASQRATFLELIHEDVSFRDAE